MSTLSAEAARLLLRLPVGIPHRRHQRILDELITAELAYCGTALGVPALLLTERGFEVRRVHERKS